MLNHGQMTSRPNKYCPECGSAHDRYLSIATAAQIFDLTEDAVRSMIKRRELPFYKMGKRTRLSYSEMMALLIRHSSFREVGLDSDKNRF